MLLLDYWKPVPGFEGKYEASVTGQVRSLSRYVRAGRGGRGMRSVPATLLKPGLTVGYPCVVLGRGNTKMVHALVAAAFIGPRPAGLDVMHADGSRTNSRCSNLQYGTRSENNKQIFADGRRKLKPIDVGFIRGQLNKGVSGVALACLFGVSESQISNIRHGRQYFTL